MRHSLVRLRFNLLVYVSYAPVRLVAQSLIRGTGGRDAKQHHQTSLQGPSLAAGPSLYHRLEEMLTILTGGRLVPGLVIFSLLGYGGQSAFNRVDAWQMGRDPTPSKPLMQRMADSKWIPLRHLSDEEYRGMLDEKLLSVEAEIALLDEKIEELESTRPVPDLAAK
ncbi:unnamed protein product [Penicillium manginii]